MVNAAQEKAFDRDLIPSLNQILEWVRENLAPDEVFKSSELSEWARENGFVSEEEDA
jgi:hypothetical protein